MPDFLLEIGTEELPAEFIISASKQWNSLIIKNLNEQLLKPKAVKIFGTPRRLAILIEDLPSKQTDQQEEIKGPPESTAFLDGRATKALDGFVRKQGVSLDDIFVRETEKGAFVFVLKKKAGRATEEILSELSKSWIENLEGKRFMRWGDGDLKFPRPIRWLLALWDKEILSLELANASQSIKSDRFSFGHRILHPEAIFIASPADYLSTLRSVKVEPDSQQRKKLILEQISKCAQKFDGEAVIQEDLLEEVVNLVEYPTAIVGGFDNEFLHLPIEVIKTVMITHQRYFPIIKEQKLIANFITISNGDPAKEDIISRGNGRVIRARLADAQFFYQADCDESLESFLPQLENVTFQDELGTMRNKVDRIIEIALQISVQLGVSSAEKQMIESTALLAKADLVTQMVYEFPELQGVMGRTYALISNESIEVAQGILEHYLPKTAEDELPKSLTGQVVGIADRLDTLVSIFGIGQIPTGSSDPFGLRRSANAIINVIWHAQLPIDLLSLLQESVVTFLAEHPNKQSPLETLRSFFIQRLDTLLKDDLNIDYDLVNAVLGVDNSEYQDRALANLLDLKNRCLFLQSIRKNRQLERIYETVNRSARLAVKGSLDFLSLDPRHIILPELFEKSSEQDFFNSLIELLPKTLLAKQSGDYQILLDGLLLIAPIVTRFFDGENSVMVIAEDLAVRNNRLNLLGLLRNHCRVIADFGAIIKA